MNSLPSEVLIDVLEICSEEIEGSRMIMLYRLRDVDDVKMIEVISGKVRVRSRRWC